MTCKQWDVAVVPFPFVETSKAKPRPVLVLSSDHFISENDHCVAAMITSATHTLWFGDTYIADISKAGLKKESIVRLKLFTLDMKFKPRVIGSLSKKDKETFLESFRNSFFYQIDETAYLSKSPNNAARLEKSIDQINKIKE